MISAWREKRSQAKGPSVHTHTHRAVFWQNKNKNDPKHKSTAKFCVRLYFTDYQYGVFDPVHRPTTEELCFLQWR
jgi:hypothetical protein